MKRLLLACCAAAALAASGAVSPVLAPPALAQRQPPRPVAPPAGVAAGIVAVVNGDVISNSDVENRTRLFALSTGQPMTPEVLDRLRPQVRQQLVDERLRLQEVQKRKIAVADKDIADAITTIESRNNMHPGALRAGLEGQGVALRTLIDQVRVQIGWTRVLQQELGTRGDISDADVAEQIRVFKAQAGQPEYNLGEIFLPIEDPAKAAETQRFAETVIGQLRSGAPFAIVATQFSQSQNALQGGDLGWVRLAQLDPAVAAVVTQMPPGAISNPITVPGGIDIVTVRQKREVGRDLQNVVTLRQVFIPFQGELNPAQPTEQQRRAVEQANVVAKAAKSCDQMEQLAKTAGSTRPADPGPVRLDTLASPAMKTILTNLPIGQPSKALVSPDGVAVVMVCGRDQKNMAEPTKQEISDRLLGERVEQAARQLQRDLRRRAVLDLRS